MAGGKVEDARQRQAERELKDLERELRRQRRRQSTDPADQGENDTDQQPESD